MQNTVGFSFGSKFCKIFIDDPKDMSDLDVFTTGLLSKADTIVNLDTNEIYKSRSGETSISEDVAHRMFMGANIFTKDQADKFCASLENA